MSASEDGKVRLYDLRGGEETLAVESSGVFCCRSVSCWFYLIRTDLNLLLIVN